MSIDVSEWHSAMASSPVTASTTAYPASCRQLTIFILRKNSSSITRTTVEWAPFSADLDKSAPSAAKRRAPGATDISFLGSLRRPDFRAAKAPNLIQPRRDGTVPYFDPFI